MTTWRVSIVAGHHNTPTPSPDPWMLHSLIPHTTWLDSPCCQIAKKPLSPGYHPGNSLIYSANQGARFLEISRRPVG